MRLWCEACRRLVHAAAAYHYPTDGRFPWMEWVRPAGPHMWLCPKCHNQHPDLTPYIAPPRVANSKPVSPASNG